MIQAEPLHLILRSPKELPTKTGRILVWTHNNNPEFVRVEEGFMEYADGSPADPDEWVAWTEIPRRVVAP